MSAIEDAMIPEVMATPASAVIQAMLAYSSHRPRLRSRDMSASRGATCAPGITSRGIDHC